MNQTERIQEALDQGNLPEWISRKEVHLIEDASGEPAAEISLIVRAGNDSVIDDGRALSRVRSQVHAVLAAAKVELWPYVAFLTEADAARQS